MDDPIKARGAVAAVEFSSAELAAFAQDDLDESAFRAKLATIARARREAAGLSPGQAAKRAQISRAAVRDVEGAHKGWPRVDTLVAYARAVGTTPWAMLRKAHEPAQQASPVDLNTILREAGASAQTWKTAEALLRALVASSPAPTTQADDPSIDANRPKTTS